MRAVISLFIIALFVTTGLTSFAQLQVTANNNATQLAQSLAGPGVVISNAKINCGAGASGTFQGTASNLGIASGILLTTGRVSDAVGPNNNGDAGTNNGINFSDPDLTGIESSATYDPCILEFDAVPSCDTLSFTFSFGSEEYPEYVNQGYNDIYGIFVTGPNPAGPAYSGYNMAILPPPTPPGTAVSINNVNNGFSNNCPATGPCTNCAYYVENCNGTSVEYDGFTKPITISIHVKPCGSYHFKLAIADAGDGKYDSGVFFSLQSLACNPLPIVLTTAVTPAKCSANNGTATVNSTGGTQPYTYTWNTVPVQVTQTATGLAPGTYSVKVADAGGCFYSTATVVVTGTGGFTSTVSSTPSTCTSGGTAAVTPAGGAAPYTYIWSPGGGATSSISGLSAGSYSVSVTDANGCTGNYSVAVASVGGFTLSTSSAPALCFAAANGTASAVLTGGTAPYTYLWSPGGAITANVTGLSAGSYSVLVTDAYGCTKTHSVTITEPAAITGNITGSANVLCFGGTNGSATASASGGVGAITYVWSTVPPQTGVTATNLSSGNYAVTIKDANGCSISQSVTITQPAALAVSITTVPASCNTKDGSATAAPSGGTPPYTYLWLTTPFIQATPTATGLGAGTYTAIVTDSKGCSLPPKPVSVLGASSLVADFSFSPGVIDWLNPFAAFTDLSSGNISTWSWNFGDPASGTNDFSSLPNPFHTYSDTGIYCIELFISDNQTGCKDSITKCLKVEGPCTIYIPNSFTPNNDGINEVFLAYGLCIKEFRMMIFDRWGNKIFESDALSKGWNGKMKNDVDIVQEDVYVWKIHIIDTYGKSHNYTGRVTVVK